MEKYLQMFYILISYYPAQDLSPSSHASNQTTVSAASAFTTIMSELSDKRLESLLVILFKEILLNKVFKGKKCVCHFNLLLHWKEITSLLLMYFLGLGIW